jgi:serine protease Do
MVLLNSTLIIAIAGWLFAAEPTTIRPPMMMPSTSPATGMMPGETSRRRDENVQLVERVKGGVVNIHSERTVNPNSDDPFRSSVMQPQRVNGMGTGIVLDPRGYIVTNYHVVDEVHSLRCRLADGTNLPARVLALDKESDLALVKIDPPTPLPLLPFGTAQDLLLAEKVIAIGNAFGYEHTVTVGSVSALKRDVTLNKEVSYKSLIQTQTPINPGNSGGPLFNKLGEVVGVNVAIRAGAQNIAFAIPVDTMISKAADMLSGKRRCGMRHGLTLADHHERLVEDGPVRRWLTVLRVESGSAAAEAGIKVDDVIEQVGDIQVRTSIDYERGFLDRATKTKIRIKRGTETQDVELSGGLAGGMGERLATQAAADVVWSKVGLKMAPVGANLVQSADKQLRGGLWVTEVGPNSAASKAGLLRGDILLGLHQWETLNIDNASYVLTHKDLATFNPLRVIFIRDGKIRESQLAVGE